jgi:DNA repair protein SbcD/Mre11
MRTDAIGRRRKGLRYKPPMRFIHTADIHLDSPLTGLSAYGDAPVLALRTATRDAFEGLVTEALRLAVDFMVIAGDLYDGNWKDFNTGIFFARQMGRLHAAGIPVYLLFGNHDAESEMTKRLTLPGNVHCFSADRPSSFELPALNVVLHGRSFKQPATTENLAVFYPPAKAGWLNIGVLHTALGGHSVHKNYAPCTAAELQARGYQYWALGHVHEHRVERLADTVIAFPGNLQGRHARETGPRGALLVSAEGTEIGTVERLHTDVLRWCALDVDISAAANLQAAVRLVGQALQQAVQAQDDALPLAARVVLSGRTALHGELFAAAATLRAEVIAQASIVAPERLWIEKVRLQTQPATQPAVLAERADAIAHLQAALQEAPADAALMQALEADLMPLLAKLPPGVREALADTAPQLELLRSGQLAQLVREVSPTLLDQVAGSASAANGTNGAAA